MTQENTKTLEEDALTVYTEGAISIPPDKLKVMQRIEEPISVREHALWIVYHRTRYSIS